MRLTITSLFFILPLLLSGCKKELTGIQWTEIQDKSDVFKVTVDAIVEENDYLSLYYTTDGSIDFSTIRPIWVPVKGKAEIQQIFFKLPPKIHPTQLRIDFGRNQNQKDIILSKVFLSCKGKRVELPGTFIFSYFQPDVTKTDFVAAKGIIRGKVISGKRQSPSLYPKEGPLGKQIEKLLAP